MLMCSRCKKRPAVVFISQMNAKDPQHKKNEGLCLVCAKELGISQVDDYMKAMGISDDDLEAMSNQLMEASDGDDFEPGGTNFSAVTQPIFSATSQEVCLKPPMRAEIKIPRIKRKS